MASEGALVVLLVREVARKAGGDGVLVARRGPEIHGAGLIQIEAHLRAVGTPAWKARDRIELGDLSPLPRAHVDEEDLAFRLVTRVDREDLPIRTPRGMAVVGITAGELTDVRSVRVHDVDVVRTVAIALKGDPLAVGTPARPDVRRLRVGELSDRGGGGGRDARREGQERRNVEHAERAERGHQLTRLVPRNKARPSRATITANTAIRSPPSKSAA